MTATKPAHEQLNEVAGLLDRLIPFLATHQMRTSVFIDAVMKLRVIAAELREAEKVAEPPPPATDAWNEATVRGAMWSISTTEELGDFWWGRASTIAEWHPFAIIRITHAYTARRAALEGRKG